MTDSLFIPLGTTWVEATEGATEVTIAVAWRIDTRSIEVQVVGVARRESRTRPAVAVEADVADAASSKTDIPATDKSQ